MQQRFCSCGRKIWVEYRFSFIESGWTTVFLPINNPAKAILTRCPSCGKSLNINILR